MFNFHKPSVRYDITSKNFVSWKFCIDFINDNYYWRFV